MMQRPFNQTCPLSSLLTKGPCRWASQHGLAYLRYLRFVCFDFVSLSLGGPIAQEYHSGLNHFIAGSNTYGYYFSLKNNTPGFLHVSYHYSMTQVMHNSNTYHMHIEI